MHSHMHLHASLRAHTTSHPRPTQTLALSCPLSSCPQNKLSRFARVSSANAVSGLAPGAGKSTNSTSSSSAGYTPSRELSTGVTSSTHGTSA